jgi:hypothetical protein
MMRSRGSPTPATPCLLKPSESCSNPLPSPQWGTPPSLRGGKGSRGEAVEVGAEGAVLRGGAGGGEARGKGGRGWARVGEGRMTGDLTPSLRGKGS